MILNNKIHIRTHDHTHNTHMHEKCIDMFTRSIQKYSLQNNNRYIYYCVFRTLGTVLILYNNGNSKVAINYCQTKYKACLFNTCILQQSYGN